MYICPARFPFETSCFAKALSDQRGGEKKWRVIKDTDVSRLNWKNGLVDRVGGDRGRKCEPETRAQNPRKRRIVPIRGGKKRKKKKKGKKEERNSRQRAVREQVSRQKAERGTGAKRRADGERESDAALCNQSCTVLHARVGTTFSTALSSLFSLLVSS